MELNMVAIQEKPTDFILYGHGEPPSDWVLYVNYFSGKKYKNSSYNCIECGASTAGISTHFFENLGWTCFNIEASKYAYKSLCSYRDKSRNLNLGLSNFNGKRVFKDIITAPGGGNDNGSFLHTENHAKLLTEYKCTFETYEVQVYTYRHLVEVPIELFVLDVEGHEVQVIEGIEGSAFLPKVICVEYPISGFNNVNNSLLNLGYKFNFISCNNAYYSFFEKDSWFGATERMPDL